MKKKQDPQIKLIERGLKILERKMKSLDNMYKAKKKADEDLRNINNQGFF